MWEFLSDLWHETWLAVLLAIIVDILQVGVRFRRMVGMTKVEEESQATAGAPAPAPVRLATRVRSQTATDDDTANPRSKSLAWKIFREALKLAILIAIFWVPIHFLAVTGELHDLFCGAGPAGDTLQGPPGWICRNLPRYEPPKRVLPASANYRPENLPRGLRVPKCESPGLGALDCELTEGGFPDPIQIPPGWHGHFVTELINNAKVPPDQEWVFYKFSDGNIYGPRFRPPSQEVNVPTEAQSVRVQGRGKLRLKAM
jgi:hypothetical protein